MFKREGEVRKMSDEINKQCFTIIDIFRQNNLEPGGDRETEGETEMLGGR